jgi:hypothetical protein
LPKSAESLIPLVEGGSYEERLSKLDEEKAMPYRMDEGFEVNDAIRHPRFGLGFVLRVRESRIEVLFKEGLKVLIHQRDRR